MDIKTVESGKILLVGYKANTAKDFFVIQKCWKKLHKNKEQLQMRTEKDWLIALNEGARYDFVKCSEIIDEDGKSDIEYWVPII